ncbi:MAG TPA: ferrous iron transport protein B [Pyrinomonadaceae bacterium]|nr:ferrous iron transport protein B [Pyrinomonadaceae bacterium]
MSPASTFPVRSALEKLPRPLTVAVAGNPNTGKTSLFNALTGLRQKVANYPGVTVESKLGQWWLTPDCVARVIDLPGLYSLEATSIDEQIARDVLIGSAANTTPDVLIVTVDATNLTRNLYLATQLIETGLPLVVALTMFDLAERNHVQIDIQKLSEAVGVEIVPVVAKRRDGIDELGRAVMRAADAGARQNSLLCWSTQNRIHSFPALKPDDDSWREALTARYRWIESVVAETTRNNSSKQRSTSERIDALATHKVFGPLILLLVMMLIFQTIFSWANLPMNLIDHVFTALGGTLRAYLPPGILTELLVDGVIAGVGGVIVFLPQILLLFLFVTLLEDSGYMARAAFLMDRLMRAFGLHGKAFVPLLSSFACAVPGIMSTRTIENPKDRLATIIIAPFMSCSARLPVYTLMIAAFFSRQKVLSFISLGALIILGMYLLGICVAIIVAWIFKHTILNGPAPPFMMELPPYRVPSFANVAHTLLARAAIFLKQAGTVIMAISILMWALVTFPRAGANGALGDQPTEVENSFAGKGGRLLEPLIAPLGFDWKIGIALISSFAARETVISTLSIVYKVGENRAAESTSLVTAMHDAKRADGSPVWTPLVALSLMVFFVLACQCMSTVAIVRRETNSWRWPVFMVSYMLVLAYAGSFITYQLGHLMGRG